MATALIIFCREQPAGSEAGSLMAEGLCWPTLEDARGWWADGWDLQRRTHNHEPSGACRITVLICKDGPGEE